MSGWKTWQLGSSGSCVYRLYDRVRKRLNQRLACVIRAQLPLTQAAYVLEAGSGTAYASSLLVKTPEIKLSAAVDIDLSALQEARFRDPTLPLVAADLHRLPFAEGAFHIIWNSSTLEHLERPSAVLEEFHRLLKSEGKIFIGVPYRSGPLGFQHNISTTRLGIWIGTVFDRAAISQLIEKSGFSILAIGLYFFHFFIGVVAEKKSSTKK